MNAIVSLSHFCELHGPSVLFSTQAFHPNGPQALLDSTLEASDCAGGWSFRGKYQRSASINSASSDVGPSASAPPTPTGTKSTDFCEACRSATAGQQGFISNDTEAKVSYVSSQHPHHPQVYSMLRNACIRSLSCEVCPGREGPIFFGDDSSGHVFSHTFFVKDSQARGFQRSYSILVVMMDKTYLLNSWPFLVSSVTNIISFLQAKAYKVYEEEQAKQPPSLQKPVYHMQPMHFRQARGPIKPARSLPELTSDKHVFKKLHQAFTMILKHGGNRLKEKLLEGPPTEDSIIDIEKEEEDGKEEEPYGFVLVDSKKPSTSSCEDEEKRRSKNSTGERWEDGEMVGVQEEDEEEDDDLVSPRFTSLRMLLKTLGLSDFHTLAHHVVIGNQVVVRGQHRATVTSVIDVLKTLLPRGCCTSVPWSRTYQDTWRCNFLGLQAGTPVPSHVELFVCVDIVEPETPGDQPGSGDGGVFEGYTFVIGSPLKLPDKAPAILQKMKVALLNNSLADSVVEQCLTCLKEEWMNKVKVRFMFTKAGGNSADNDTKKLLPIIAAGTEDLPVLTFWMTGLSNQYRTHMLSLALAK